MKICFVHEEYPSETNFGGIATYQKIMAEYYANNGDIVYVVSRGKNDTEYIENNVHVIRVASDNDNNNIKSVKEYRKKVACVLKKLQNEDKIEIIEVPDWGANTIYFEKDRRIPIVVRLHTPLKIWLDYNNNNFGMAKDLILKWENIMLKKCDAITSCSSLLKDMVIKQYKLDRDIVVVPNPYNNKDFKVDTVEENNNLIYVGSLEERKGVLLLAEALNDILKSIDNNCIYIVGKDTNRNSKNISTKEYMLDIINKKYHNRVKFIGQVNNSMVNAYLNKSYLAIYPSIFDNYPYTILESMASGKHIICSDNIGNADLVKINNYTFKTNDSSDLTKKVLTLMNEKRNFINCDNINLVNNICNQDYVCGQMKKIYLETIKRYKYNAKEKEDIITVLKKVSKFNRIKKIRKLANNLANIVYIVFTDMGNYVVKKYNYTYDFKLCEKLYDIYNNNNINIVKPINKNVIRYNDYIYNIFEYYKTSIGTINKEYIDKLINVDRRINKKANILSKCNKYCAYLNNLSSYKIETEIFVKEEYKKIKNLCIFKDRYINHGDLSKSNIIFSNKTPYIIDFDEAVITTKLYDYIVVLVKIYFNTIELNYNSIKDLIIDTMPDNSYSINDYLTVLRFYMCKILLEKFYLYECNKIDLFSESQINDDYRKYLNILKAISK